MLALTRRPAVTAVALALSAIAMPASSAFAQQAPAADQAKETAELERVTVTANRRVEDQQRVAVSVTGVSGATLAERNITDLSQMEGMSAGFTFGRSGTDARPAIRGVRTENVAVNADTTIGFFVDGVYRSRAQQAMAPFVDVRRVEIQRGPQGTLFGRNTFGGNIAITTNEPDETETQIGGSLLGGSLSRVRGEAVFNSPLSNTMALRFAGAIESADPWVENDFNSGAGLFDQDQKFVRLSFKSQPLRDLTAIFRIDATEQGGNGGSAFGYKQAGTYVHTPSCQQLFNSSLAIINPRPGNRDAVNDCVRTQGAGAGTGVGAIGTGVDLGIPLYKAGNAYRVDNDYRSFLDLSDRNIGLDLAYKLGSLTIKSITGYADFKAERTSDSDFSASTIAIDYQNTEAKTWSQEFQILSDGSRPLSYVGGAYYFKDELTGTFINQQLPRTIRSSAIGAPLSLAQNGAGFFDQQLPETESTGLYAQASYRLTDALTATAGARYTRDKKSFKFANANSVLPRTGAGLPDGTQIGLGTPLPPTSAFGAPGVSNCVGSNAVRGFNCEPGTNILYGATYDDATFSKTTWRVAVDYQINRTQLVYASVSTGFRSGGFNSGQAIAALRTFQPEEVTAYEVGSKNRFLGNTLQLNVAAFSNRYSNLQEQRQVPVGATTISTIFNAARAKADGLEFESQWRATRALTLGGSLSLLDAKYTSFPDVALPFGTSILVADPASTSPQTDSNGVVIAPAGQRRLFAPGYNCGVVPGTGGTGQPAAAFGCDLSGKRLPYSPRYQGAISARYEFPAPFGGTLTPLAAVTFSGGYYGQPANAEIEKQGSYVKVDLKLNWRANDKFALQAFVDNATDEQIINRFVWGGGGALQISAAPPRTFGLRLSYNMY